MKMDRELRASGLYNPKFTAGTAPLPFSFAPTAAGCHRMQVIAAAHIMHCGHIASEKCAKYSLIIVEKCDMIFAQ